MNPAATDDEDDYEEVPDEDHIVRLILRGDQTDDFTGILGSGFKLGKGETDLSYQHLEHHAGNSIVEQLDAMRALNETEPNARDRYSVHNVGVLREMLLQATGGSGIKIVHTPYKGGGGADHVSVFGLDAHRDKYWLLDKIALAVKESYNIRALPDLPRVRADYDADLAQLEAEAETRGMAVASHTIRNFLEGVALLEISKKGGVSFSESGDLQIRWELEREQWIAIQFKADGKFAVSSTVRFKGASQQDGIYLQETEEIGEVKALIKRPVFAALFTSN